MITRKFTPGKRSAIETFFTIREEPLFRYDPLTDTYGRITSHKGIVDVDRDNLMSVVYKDYQIVTNQQAYSIASGIVDYLFKGTKLTDFECFNVVMPKTRSFCRIDLILPERYYRPFGDNLEDIWKPFLRISNSYNKTSILKYEIGFCRWICLNGMIGSQRGITISVDHSDRYYLTKIMNQVRKQANEVEDVNALWKKLSAKLANLRKLEVSPDMVYPMFCKAFGIILNEAEMTDKIKNNWKKRRDTIDGLKKEYFKEMGNNAYAMMNILTDFASDKVLDIWKDGYQKKVGLWIDDLQEKSKYSTFSMDKYIDKEYRNSASIIENL